MSNFVPNKVFLRGVLLHYFNMKLSAAESHRILLEVYGDHALAEQTCRKWFARFKSGNFDLVDKERPGQPKKFKDEELEALLNGDSCQTLQELSGTLGVDLSTVRKRLKVIEKRKAKQLGQNNGHTKSESDYLFQLHHLQAHRKSQVVGQSEKINLVDNSKA